MTNRMFRLLPPQAPLQNNPPINRKMVMPGVNLNQKSRFPGNTEDYAQAFISVISFLGSFLNFKNYADARHGASGRRDTGIEATAPRSLSLWHSLQSRGTDDRIILLNRL